MKRPRHAIHTACCVLAMSWLLTGCEEPTPVQLGSGLPDEPEATHAAPETPEPTTAEKLAAATEAKDWAKATDALVALKKSDLGAFGAESVAVNQAWVEWALPKVESGGFTDVQTYQLQQHIIVMLSMIPETSRSPGHKGLVERAEALIKVSKREHKAYAEQLEEEAMGRIMPRLYAGMCGKPCAHRFVPAIQKDFEDNELAAGKAYSETFVVEGDVHRVRKGTMPGQVVVELEPSKFDLEDMPKTFSRMAPAQAYLSKGQDEEAMVLKPGDRAVLTCQKARKSIHLALDDCTIVTEAEFNTMTMGMMRERSFVTKSVINADLHPSPVGLANALTAKLEVP